MICLNVENGCVHEETKYQLFAISINLMFGQRSIHYNIDIAALCGFVPIISPVEATIKWLSRQAAALQPAAFSRLSYPSYVHCTMYLTFLYAKKQAFAFKIQMLYQIVLTIRSTQPKLTLTDWDWDLHLSQSGARSHFIMCGGGEFLPKFKWSWQLVAGRRLVTSRL